MRKYLSLSLMGFALSLTTLAAPSYASKLAGPIYTHTEREQKEFEHLYSGINTLINSITGGATFSSLSVSSLTVTTINGLTPGKLRQVVFFSTTTATSTTSTSFVTTALSTTITPSTTTSSIVVCTFGGVSSNGASGRAEASLFVATTNILGSNPFFEAANSSISSAIEFSAYCHLHAPASVSAQTYSTRIRTTNAATTVSWGGGGTAVTTSILLFEVGP